MPEVVRCPERVRFQGHPQHFSSLFLRIVVLSLRCLDCRTLSSHRPLYTSIFVIAIAVCMLVVTVVGIFLLGLDV